MPAIEKTKDSRSLKKRAAAKEELMRIRAEKKAFPSRVKDETPASSHLRMSTVSPSTTVMSIPNRGSFLLPTNRIRKTPTVLMKVGSFSLRRPNYSMEPRRNSSQLNDGYSHTHIRIQDCHYCSHYSICSEFFDSISSPAFPPVSSLTLLLLWGFPKSKSCCKNILILKVPTL